MTQEQREVARLLCLGKTKRAIGLELGLTSAGVDGRLRRAYQATGAQCQIELGMWCVANGVVPVPELQKVYGAAAGPGEKRAVPKGRTNGIKVGSARRGFAGFAFLAS
jgi:hypothetical protein